MKNKTEQITTLVEECQQNSELHWFCTIWTIYRLQAVCFFATLFQLGGCQLEFQHPMEPRLQPGSTHHICQFLMSHRMSSCPASHPHPPFFQENFRFLILAETTPKAVFPPKQSPHPEQLLQKQDKVICCLSILVDRLVPNY